MITCFLIFIQMEEKVKEIVEIKQRSLAEENQKTLEVLRERYPSYWLSSKLYENVWEC